MKDYYKILGLSKNSSIDIIKQRFKELAFEYHPDVSASKNATEIFMGIYEAYHILSDPGKKADYDLLHDKYINNFKTQIHNEEYIKDDIQNISDSVRENGRQKARIKYKDFIKDQDCFFMAGQKANGMPYYYHMHKNVGISGGVGPMGTIKSKTVSIPIPRSKKTLLIHRVGFFTKVIFLVIAVVALRLDVRPDAVIITKILIPSTIILTGGLITHLVYYFNKTHSTFFYTNQFFLVQKYKKNGYSRGFHPMISTTPLGLIVFLLRLIF